MCFWLPNTCRFTNSCSQLVRAYCNKTLVRKLLQRSDSRLRNSDCILKNFGENDNLGRKKMVGYWCPFLLRNFQRNFHRMLLTEKICFLLWKRTRPQSTKRPVYLSEAPSSVDTFHCAFRWLMTSVDDDISIQRHPVACRWMGQWIVFYLLFMYKTSQCFDRFIFGSILSGNGNLSICSANNVGLTVTSRYWRQRCDLLSIDLSTFLSFESFGHRQGTRMIGRLNLFSVQLINLFSSI